MPHRLQRIFPRVQGAKAASSRCAALTAKYWRRQRLGAGVWEVLAALAPDLPWIFASSESDTPQARLNFGEFWVSGGAVSSVWIWRILGIRQCWVSGDAGAGCPIMPLDYKGVKRALDASSATKNFSTCARSESGFITMRRTNSEILAPTASGCWSLGSIGRFGAGFALDFRVF